MSESIVIAAARSAVKAAQAEMADVEGVECAMALLSSITLAYGYVRGALEAAGVSRETLDAAEEVGAQLAQQMERKRRIRIQEGMVQA